MRYLSAFLQALTLSAVSALAASTTSAAVAQLEPPIAEKRPHQVASPHGSREDEFYWLRDDKRENPDVLNYLAAENAYTQRVLAGMKPLAEKLYGEFLGRMKQDEDTVPSRLKTHWYYSRFVAGKEYSIKVRRKGGLDAPDQVMLDQNERAANKPYYGLSGTEISQDEKLLAFSEDTVGRRLNVLRFKSLETGAELPDSIENVTGFVWANDNKTIFYVERDPAALMELRVKTHVLGTPSADDKLIYEEQDTTYSVGVARMRSDKFLCITISKTDSSEYRCTSADQPGEFQLFAPRMEGHDYNIEHLNGRWVISTNWNARNSRLMTLRDDSPLGDRERWVELVPHDPNVAIRTFELFNGFMAIGERTQALTRIRLLHDDGQSRLIESDEPAYSMSLGINPEPDVTTVRYSYTSLVTPDSTYEVDVMTGERKLLKRMSLPSGYDASKYTTERVWAPGRDGTLIPVSLAYRRGLKRDGTAPLIQAGYGAYGSSRDASFNPRLISALDRGAVFAQAHVRGGFEMGRSWYEGGRQLNKKNTFTDFIDVTRFLVREGYADKNRVAAVGGSAGGLLVAAVANMAPSEYRVVFAAVPFVDVVTTMLDESIPMTTIEYDEWGDPRHRSFHDYILSYSPYDNVQKQAYPAMLVTAGLWDSQVQYYEPAKWVARRRDRKTDANPLVLRMEMQSGHDGNSGRFREERDAADEWAFVLSQLGAAEENSQ